MTVWTFIWRLFGWEKTEFIYPCCGVKVKLTVPLRHKEIRKRCQCHRMWYFNWKGDQWRVGSSGPHPPVEVEVVEDEVLSQAMNEFTERFNRTSNDFSVNVNTDEAIADFREKVKTGVCGITSQKDFLRNQRLLALYDRDYSEAMLYDEFLGKISSGEIKEPEPHSWKMKRQFWYDRQPTALELTQCKARPSKFRCATLFWLRSDQTMWYSQCFFYSFLEGPSNLEVAKLKMKNAIQTIEFASESQEPQEKVTDAEYLADVERCRASVNGNYFETEDLIPVIAGMPL